MKKERRNVREGESDEGKETEENSLFVDLLLFRLFSLSREESAGEMPVRPFLHSPPL